MENLIAAEVIKTASSNEINKQKVRQCVEELCKHEVERENLRQIESSVKNVAMNMHIIEANNRA